MPDIPSKFQKHPFITFWVILYTHTHRQTNKTQQKHNLLGGGNNLNTIMSWPVSVDDKSASAGKGINRLEMSRSSKSGNIAIKSCSFCSRIIHDRLPVGRRTWSSAQWEHQQLQTRGLNTDRSVGFAFRPVTKQIYHVLFYTPPRSATLTWWWGSAPMTQKISKTWRQGATKRWPNSCRQIATRYQCSCAGFGFTADYGFIAATCNHVVTFEDAHWAELIRPQRWAGVRACPPRR